MKYKVNQEKCIGCGVCLQSCPGATEFNSNGKVDIISQEKLAECGGESVCPMGAIEKISEEESQKESSAEKNEEPADKSSFEPERSNQGIEFGRGLRGGRGMGAGQGRGMGLGPRDGRGQGMGGGGRK